MPGVGPTAPSSTPGSSSGTEGTKPHAMMMTSPEQAVTVIETRLL